MRLIPTTGKNYQLRNDRDMVVGDLNWVEWPHGTGYIYHPMSVARSATRKPRADLRETLIKGVRLKAKTADRAIASLKVEVSA